MMDTRISDIAYGARTRDLGRLETPVLVCGGAYSNLEALSALLEAAGTLSIPPERIIHTGDVIAYCADPAKTAELLRAAQVHAIQGNVEESLSASLADCQCGFEADSLCNELSAEWYAYADAGVGVELRRWMGQLPHHLIFEMSGQRIRVIHGGVKEINRFVFASQPACDFETEFAAADADVIIAGHSGLPFTRCVGHRVWHNSGPLGLPANDGTQRAWFSVLTPQDDGLVIVHHELDYDHDAARRKMVTAGLCAGYSDALRTGVWPSLDVLPPVERRQTGVPLDLSEPIHLTAGAALPALVSEPTPREF